MNHVNVVHTDCEQLNCAICDGGLFLCAVCGCAEGATTDDCPGVQIPWESMDKIYNGTLNFRAGYWRRERSDIWEYPGSKTGIPKEQSTLV